MESDTGTGRKCIPRFGGLAQHPTGVGGRDSYRSGCKHSTHMWYLKNFGKEGKFLLRLVLLVTIKDDKCKFKL